MSVVSLTDMKAYLGITVSTSDTKLQAEIDAAEDAITARCGALTSVSRTERIEGGKWILVLPVGPAISLTSVTPYQGTALTLTDLYLNTHTDAIEQNSGASFSARFYTVVYNAGRTTCPDDLLRAIKELTRFNWQSSQRAASGRTGTTRSDQVANTIPGANREFPFEVERIVALHAQIVG